MKELLKNLSIVREIVIVVIATLIFGVIYWITLPAFASWGFFLSLLVAIAIPSIVGWMIASSEYENTLVGVAGTIISAAIIVFMLVAFIAGGTWLNANKYASGLNIQNATVEEAQENLPSFEDVANISLMDTPSARKLGDRMLGNLADYVSQYDVSSDYTTISYQGRVVKVAPLEHGGFFKAMKNDTIPGYVVVDTLTNEASFFEVEGGFKYSPSAYFGKDLLRHIRSEYTDLLGSYFNFQIDEKANPYWVVTTFEYSTFMGAKVPSGAILVNAVTGEMAKYNLDEIPTWVDQVVDGDTVTTLYNRYGRLSNGAFNFSDTGKTQVTDDYGYVEKDGDIYIYTGVTSVAADESNIGFIMVNSRTGECTYYPVAGAEEYSAMSAAEGMVQNFGYEASFPSLVMYGSEPTYVMVLKDSNGLVKMYAMVNMKNYTIVTVGETLQECQNAYVKAMTNVGTAAEITDAAVSELIVISAIEFVTVQGETIVYVKSTDGRVFKQAFAENESLILLNVGDEVEVKYAELQTITPAEISK